MWPRTDLLDLLGIDNPIIQAPMAGSTTPALAAAVSNAGGLGSIGCATIAPDKLGETADELRATTNRAFNLNFFAHEAPVPNSAKDERVRQRVAAMYDEAGLGAPPAFRRGPPGSPAGYQTGGGEFPFRLARGRRGHGSQGHRLPHSMHGDKCGGSQGAGGRRR